MDYLSIKRFKQLFQFGWQQSKELSVSYNVSRKKVFFDMFHCFLKYHIWSNQYAKENFFLLTDTEKDTIGKGYKAKNDERDNWIRDKHKNIVFLEKWTKRKWECDDKRIAKRYKAYALRYNIDKGGAVSNNVVIERNHFLNGTISIGKNVLLSKNVFIDYSGEVVIKDNVQLTNGVIIETHHHSFHSDPSVSRDIVVPTKIVIEDGAVIGSRAIILDSCHYIGKNARVGAGSVVTKDVPDNAVAVGAPARVIRISE